MSEHSDMIDSTSAAISARLSGSSLRRMAVDLYGDTARAGLLADVLNMRISHVSHANLHDLRRRLGLSYDVRYIVDVPADHDAAVHMTTNGTGRLDVVYVPDTTQVVIVPAGSQRLAQPKQPSAKPKRERTQKDVTRLKRRGWSDAEIERVLRVMYDYPGDLAAVAEVLAKLEQD